MRRRSSAIKSFFFFFFLFFGNRKVQMCTPYTPDPALYDGCTTMALQPNERVTHHTLFLGRRGPVPCILRAEL